MPLGYGCPQEEQTGSISVFFGASLMIVRLGDLLDLGGRLGEDETVVIPANKASYRQTLAVRITGKYRL
jgi:hypothetical protein